MTAIYKRELGSYFHSLTGWLFIALLLAIVGMYFVVGNVLGGEPRFAVSLNSALYVYLVAIPVLSMRSVAGERRSRTDQALLTSPNTVYAIVAGKFCAMATVLLLPSLFFCLFPPLIRTLGEWNPKLDFAAIAMFFLIGCVYLSAGMLISSLTESQILSAIGTFAVVLVFYLWDQLAGYLPYTPESSLAGLLLLDAVLCLLLRAVSGSRKLSVIVPAGCAAVEVAAYLIRRETFAGLLRRLLLCFSVNSQISAMISAGSLDLGGVILDLSFIALFLFLTVQSIEKRRWS